MAKPFTMRVFVARLVALLDRAASLPAPDMASAHTYRLHDVTFDATSNRLVTPAQCVHLTPTESRILRLLVRYQGQVLPTARIAQQLWGYDSAEAGNVVKTHIRHLRVKMEQLPTLPYSVQTVPGSGYLPRRAGAHAYEATA